MIKMEFDKTRPLKCEFDYFNCPTGYEYYNKQHGWLKARQYECVDCSLNPNLKR